MREVPTAPHTRHLLADPHSACGFVHASCQVVDKLPLPLVKICDFGYSKADFKSAAKSQVRSALQPHLVVAVAALVALNLFSCAHL